MRVLYGTVALILVCSIFFSCETQLQKEERLARFHCASCHSFPDPSLLDKKNWEKGVFPEMAFRMGHDYALMRTLSEADQKEALKVIPDGPMLTDGEWQAIRNYYLTTAPDSLIALTADITDSVDQFHIRPLRLPIHAIPLTTFVLPDTLNNKIYVGNRFGRLYQFDTRFTLLDSFQLDSPPSHMLFHKNENPLLLIMGIMDPNDQFRGELAQLKLSDRTSITRIDSLKRPVHFEEVDLNKDNLQDYIVCEFGDYTGALTVYKNMGHEKFEKHFLQTLPGARKVIVNDFDNNGLMDILALMSQGDEKIILLHNQGNFNFRITTLLRFPPIYGSSYFDVADFNNDGKFDILYSNGDNADYSAILKPYHGVRIFLNDGKNQFSESWFYPMHGASQARAHDFDQDGDIDIAAISFFPDFKTHPEQGLIYFKNTGKDFIPQVTHVASAARWLTMNTSDFDHDGDTDILVGALNFESGAPVELVKRWAKEETSILILENKLH